MKGLLVIAISFLLAGCAPKAQPAGSAPDVKTGIEVLRDNGFKELQGKRVGLVTNPTGVDRNLVSTVDILANAEGVELVALYGPEHGVRGNVHAGGHVDSSVDPATGLPVYSLYGATRKPTKEMLDSIDVIVYDIQDNGCRSFTYISTLGLLMEAAAEYDKELMVLDRPNPLGGNKVEGCYVELMNGLQWIQIDLEKSADIYAIALWHYHSQERAYKDVIVQISDDPEFKSGVTTVFNNDEDNSAKMGVGKNMTWVETNYGKIIEVKPSVKGRYVRFYSNGNTTNDTNAYIEVEIYGK